MAKSLRLAAIFAAFALAGFAANETATTNLPFAGPIEAGTLSEPQNREASGLAASRRTPGLLWVHNDSGGEPVLYGIDANTGQSRGRVVVRGVTNTDWEDIASFEHDGAAWLVIGDVGDNTAKRSFILLHFVREPDANELSPARDTEISPAYTLRVAYEDLARDCESIAVDAREGAVYLLSKRDSVPRLYRVPLAPSKDLVIARRVGEVPELPQPDVLQRLLKIPTGAYRGEPTAMDFAADGSAAVVLTYGDTLLFPRAANETWAQALAKKPVILAPHDLPQAEAACFSADGRAIFLASEESMRLLRYDRR
jgi:hypothetical protein